MRIIDANIILRYLLDDDPTFTTKAVDIIEQESAHIPFEIIAEVVYVMNGLYNIPRTTITAILTKFIQRSNITTNDLDVLKYALIVFSEKGIDFVDSLLCAYHQIKGYQIATFDKKLNKCCINRLGS